MSAKNANSIQVCIKVRPCEPGLTSLWQVKEGCSIHLADSDAEPCVFDYVFDESANNQEVFDRMAKHIVHACMQGFNGTIFAYGQTSSGKTYTMMGDGQNPGIMVLAAKEIFQHISNETERDFLLRVGYIEIYNEKIYDLLKKNNHDLKIHESGHGIVKVNCEECIVTSEDELLSLLSKKNKELTVGESNVNERTRHSHAIFRIIIESRKSEHSDDDTVIQSVLNLVDLAGSERENQTGARGCQSLLFLSNVIKSLSENADKFISFRDSKLTRILQASLGGNAFTSIICTIKPSIMEESRSTLSFALRAKKIRIKPKVNEIVSDTMMKLLDREIKVHKDKLAEEKLKNESQLKVQDLEQRIKRDMLKIISSNSLNEQRMQKRRRTWTCGISGPEAETAVTLLPTLPEESRLPRPSKMSNLPKPTFLSNSNHSSRREIALKTISLHQSVKEKLIPPVSMDLIPALPKLLEKEAVRSIPSVTCEVPKKEQKSSQNCDALQAEVSALTASNQVANEKIEKYEEQVKTLKETIERLEMDNREAVNLGLRFESHKTKSKQLETDLLSALSERDSTIESLQQSLKELSRDVLLNSKEDHLRSMCPEIESSCERICNKCQELEHLLPIADATGLETIACQCDQLRSEIAATRTKLESVQSAFSEVSCEVSQKTTDCERLSRQISTAHDDFGLLQARYDTLEHQWQGQQLAIEKMEAEYNAIQQKYQKLQEEYDNLGLRSDEQCQQLQADNAKLQAEIVTLKTRVEEAQRKLLEAPNPESLAEEFKAQNQELKAQLSDLQSKFKEIQNEYDCLSNQLMESVQENDALREELKQRPSSFDVDSMKSSGVGTECSDPELDLDSDLLQQFIQLSESIQQIELHHHSGCSRLFKAINLEQDQNATGVKLCLESAEYIESDTRQLDTSDSVCLKGSFKRHRFQIVRLSQEQVDMEEEKGLRNVITQLEQEVKDKMTLIGDAEATINEMREEMISLESDLLDKSIIVNKVDDYHRQIESLEKQNAEMSIVYKELQATVSRQSSMNESSLEISPDDETLIACPPSPNNKDLESQEVITLKASLAELRTKVCDLQSELESQLKQMQLRDSKIAKLQTDIEEMGERCLSMELKVAELEEEGHQKQELLDRQAQKLSDDLRIIDQLQERNATLVDRSIKAEESLKLERTKQEQTIVSFEYEKQIQELSESLKRAKENVCILEKKKTDDINAIQLEYMVKMETSENENRTKFRAYSLELEESKDHYESSVAALKDQLSKAGEELSSVTTRCQAELEGIKVTLQEKITQAEEERNKLTTKHQAELEKIKELLKEKLAAAEVKQAKIEADYKAEISDVRVTLKEQLSQAEEEREKACLKLDELIKTLEEMECQRSAMKDTIAELEEAKHDREIAFDKLKIEKIKLEKMYDKSQEQLQRQFRTRDQNSMEAQAQSERLDGLLASSNEKITELQEKCEQQVLELDKLRQDKIALETEIQKVTAEHSSTLTKLQELKSETDTLNSKMLEKSHLEDKLETFTAKISDLEEALHGAKVKLLANDDLVSQHDRLKICLSEANVLSSNTQKKVDRLHLELLTLQDGIATRDVEMEQLRSELKSALDAKATASTEQQVLVTQLKEIEEKMSTQAEKFKREMADLKGSMNELQLKLKSLQETKDNLEAGNEDLKLKLTNCHNLENMLKEEQSLSASLRESIDKLERSKNNLEEQIRTKEAEVDQRFMELRREVELGRNNTGELAKECEKLHSDLETKTDNFQREKKNLDSVILALQNDKQQLEEKLTILIKKDEANAGLKAQLTSTKVELTSQQEASTNLKLAMEAANNKSLEMGQKFNDLSGECEKLRSDLQFKESCFLMEKDKLDGTISDLLKNKHILEKNLSALNEKHTKECEKLRLALLKADEAAFASLQESSNKHQLAMRAANKKSLEMGQKVDELTKESEKLRSTLKSKETSFRTKKERMDGTICSLLEDKRNLEEKLCSLSEMTTKLEFELAALQAPKVNVNFVSSPPNGSSTSATDLAAKKPLDRNASTSVAKKSASIESTVRKNRRITAYDEHRKQSCWNDFRDGGTMTESMDNNCNCAEPSCKHRLNQDWRQS
ncbi:kinesin-like protein KIN-7O [Drosophila rhopaloa]|uniref:Kinesin motor domain-containing protein n=1 Tax=Drosophila rhopaloa TaxID=1041015 RepID=A0ABM5HEH5_DRORH|nr:kinesin-like protein KIN-7O [Drosophila rhopaloa]